MLSGTLTVAGVLDPAKALSNPDAEAHVFEFREAARCAASGSEREQQSVAKYVEAVEALPDVKARVFEFRYAARYAAHGSVLERQAALGFARAVKNLPDARARLFECLDSVFGARPGSELESQTVSGLARAVEDLPVMPTVYPDSSRLPVMPLLAVS